MTYYYVQFNHGDKVDFDDFESAERYFITATQECPTESFALCGFDTASNEIDVIERHNISETDLELSSHTTVYVEGKRYTDYELLRRIPQMFRNLFERKHFKNMDDLSRALMFAHCAEEKFWEKHWGYDIDYATLVRYTKDK